MQEVVHNAEAPKSSVAKVRIYNHLRILQTESMTLSANISSEKSRTNTSIHAASEQKTLPYFHHFYH